MTVTEVFLLSQAVDVPIHGFSDILISTRVVILMVASQQGSTKLK